MQLHQVLLLLCVRKWASVFFRVRPSPQPRVSATHNGAAARAITRDETTANRCVPDTLVNKNEKIYK